jgi:hypothetical protein
MAQETADLVMERVTEAAKASTIALDIRLVLVDADKTERERRMQTLSRTDGGRTRTLTVFLSPSSVKNTRFLTVEQEDGNSDQWIFLPALGKVKRIAAQQGGTSFMGSDFTYDDMDSMHAGSANADHRLLEDASIDGTSCFVVESRPTGSGGYAKTVSWIDKQTYVPLKVAFYDRLSADPTKVLEASDIRMTDGRWLARTLVMTELSSGHSTRIEILQAKYDIPIDERYFTVTFLENGRI